MTKITEEHIGWLVNPVEKPGIPVVPRYLFPAILKIIEDSRYCCELTQLGELFWFDEIKLLELKPVNENCLFKDVLVEHGVNWIRHIFIGYDGDPKASHPYIALTSKMERGYGFCKPLIFYNAKRCPDVIYGDENE